MHRVVEPELLDDLSSLDPLALGSRADLRRLNFLMGNAGFLARAIEHHRGVDRFHARTLRVVELGAGDGTLLLKLARRWPLHGVTAEVTLLDRQNLVSKHTHRAFAALNWSVETVASDVFEWLEAPGPVADLMVANLFLHHFSEERLAKLLALAAARTNLFVACEPRRSRLALAAARSVSLLGCNAVTRHDALASVRAGFSGQELSRLWPRSPDWDLSEQSPGFFSHGFGARRHD